MPSINLPHVGRVEYQISHQTGEPALVIGSLPPELRPIAQQADSRDVYEETQTQVGRTRREVISRLGNGQPWETRISQDMRTRVVKRAGGANGLLERGEHDRSVPSALWLWRRTERAQRVALNSIEDAVAQAVADRRQAKELLAGPLSNDMAVATKAVQRRLRVAMSTLQSDRDLVLHGRLAEALDLVALATSVSDLEACLQQAEAAIEEELAPTYHAEEVVKRDVTQTQSWISNDFWD